jgi:hypothetical protein
VLWPLLPAGCRSAWADANCPQWPGGGQLETRRDQVNCADFSFQISGKIQLANEPSHSFYQSHRLECLSCIPTRSVVAVLLVYWSATACAMHTTHFPAPDSGRSTSCSSASRVSVAPRCLLHEVDQVHGVVVHFPVLAYPSWSSVLSAEPSGEALRRSPRPREGQSHPTWARRWRRA